MSQSDPRLTKFHCPLCGAWLDLELATVEPGGRVMSTPRATRCTRCRLVCRVAFDKRHAGPALLLAFDLRFMVEYPIRKAPPCARSPVPSDS